MSDSINQDRLDVDICKPALRMPHCLLWLAVYPPNGKWWTFFVRAEIYVARDLEAPSGRS
jgi:hypothetical protein